METEYKSQVIPYVDPAPKPCELEPAEWINHPGITPADLIGPAAHILKKYLAKIERMRDRDGAKLKLLLHGKPGDGKSEIMRLLATALVTDKMNLEESPGRQVSFEVAGEWRRNIRHRSFFDGWRAILIEEIDCVARNAQDLMLDVLDKLPPHFAVIGTSNKDFTELTERFQGRFQVVEVTPPQPEEVADWMHGKWPMIPLEVCTAIARRTGGHVRSALLDAQTWLDANG